MQDYTCVACNELCCVYLPNSSQVTNYNFDLQCINDVTIHPKTTANEVALTPVVCITSYSQSFDGAKPAIIELKKTARLNGNNKIIPLYSSTDHPNWREVGEGCEMLDDWIRFKTTHFSYFTVIGRFPPPTASIVINPTLADSVKPLTVPELPGLKVDIPPESVKSATEIKATLYYDDPEVCGESADLPLASACVQLEPHHQQFTNKIPVQIPIPGYSEIVKENPHATLQLWYTPTSPKDSSANWVLDEKTEWKQSQSDCGDCTVTILTDHFSTWGIKWSQPIAGLAKVVGDIFNRVESWVGDVKYS